MISHHHKVLFVHIPKCAGQSIERAFLRDLRLDWSNRHGLLLRPKKCYESGPERLAHLYANEYVGLGYVSEQDFRRFYKFCIVRDPIDRIISELNYRRVIRGTRGVHSIEEYVEQIRKKFDTTSDFVRHLEPQVNFIFDSKMEKIIVDDVIHFNNIEVCFQRLKAQKNCSNLQLRKENVSQVKSWYRSELSQSDIEFIKEYYAHDFAFVANCSTRL